MRLTEELLDRKIAEHVAGCIDCQDGYCDRVRRIEASFDDEVDRQIDEAKERRR